MDAFTYVRASSLGDALDPAAALIAGGTDLFNLMKEGICAPRRLIDISRLDLATIDETEDGISIGALATLADIGRHPRVQAALPVLAQAIEASASPQIRNVATLGGNLLQQTRCPYYRAETALACNKRKAGSGCSAIGGEDRAAAIFGWSDACIATHASDPAVALVALDAVVHVLGGGGTREIPLVAFHRLPGDNPARDTVLEPGDLIVRIVVPAAMPRSAYVKVRERWSYEFALVSAAAAVALNANLIEDARVALGGVAAKPWRLRAAEAALRGVAINDPEALYAALQPAFVEARPRRNNGFKIELALRAALGALGRA